MASVMQFLFGLVWFVGGVLFLAIGRGHLFGGQAQGRPVQLAGAGMVLFGLVYGVIGGLLGWF